MSFLTFVETEATPVETAVVDGLKAGLNYVDNVLVTEICPELLAALKGALSVMEQTALAEIVTSNTPSSPVTTPGS